MNKYKKYMIICICILAFSIVGSTVAYYVGVYFRINASTITYGLDYYINYNKGQNISSASLEGSSSYLGGSSSDIELWKKDDTYDIYGHLYLDIVDIGSNLSTSQALRYTVVNNNNVISEGTLAGNTTGDSLLIAPDIPLQTSKQLYTVYIWLDELQLLGQPITGEYLSLVVRCEATMKPYFSTSSSTSLISHVASLYRSGNPTLITHNKDDGTSNTYYYSYQDSTKSWGLMNDGLKVASTFGTGSSKITDKAKLRTGTEGNIRYFGPSDSVNNYVYFNCDTYPDTNCERWRIIGIVDGKLKIIRDESIGKIAWDQDKNQNSSLITYSNNWETSSLQLFLNGLYYNRGNTETHTYYSGTSGEITTNLNMVNIGIKNDITRGMISKSTWYLGGYSNTNIYPNDMYTYERTNTVGTTIRSGNSYTINANIGLTSASDYGYGTNLTKCNSKLSSYNSDIESYACKTNNWIFNNTYQWLITPFTSDSKYSCSAYSGGHVTTGTISTTSHVVRPTLYLDSSVLKVGGDGSYDTPYLIGTGVAHVN